jgi:hypothetical protein
MEKFKCRERINQEYNLIENYLTENSDTLTTMEKKTIEGFKHKISGDFVILKCLKNHAIFLHTKSNDFYAVKSLSERFDEKLPDFPVLINTTILPFGNSIIYDGFYRSYNLYFGPEMTWEMNQAYKKAKAAGRIFNMIDH